MKHREIRFRRTARWVLFLCLAVATGGCDDPLEVNDPTAILDSQVNSAAGAGLLRLGALESLFATVPRAAWYSGLIADEFFHQQSASVDNLEFPYSDEALLDKRGSFDEQERLPAGIQTSSYFTWQQLRLRTTPIAIEKLQAYGLPGAREAHVGEMFAVRAYAAMRLAEDYCPGLPLYEVKGLKLVDGPQVSTEEAFEYALANFDSALTWAADSTRVQNFARVARGRTLLQLGKFAEASAAVSSVPTTYTYLAEYNISLSPTNELSRSWFTWTNLQRSIADREGGNGLNFISAGDPRVTSVRTGVARNGQTTMYGIGKYPTRAASITLASGIEARLIEAEAALRTADARWLAILNDLRANAVSPGLGPLADPGNPEARLDLLFRERAFWLFATGTRLGDLRRLVRVYGRSSESVFPTGTYWHGGNYGPATSIPISRDERRNFGIWCTGY